MTKHVILPTSEEVKARIEKAKANSNKPEIKAKREAIKKDEERLGIDTSTYGTKHKKPAPTTPQTSPDPPALTEVPPPLMSLHPTTENNAPVFLPAWAEAVRGVPNGFLRSALFSATANDYRPYLKKEPLVSEKGFEIFFTGEKLNQTDLDVWECILHYLRREPLGKVCHFRAADILRIMDLADSGQNRAALDERLIRLKAHAIHIKQGRFSYAGSLIDFIKRDDKTFEYMVWFNPDMKALFEAGHFTHVQWDIRRKLNKKPLAQWLHGFYSSHSDPHPRRIETIQELCGSRTVEPRKFKQQLKEAFLSVSEAAEACGEFFDFELIDDLIKAKNKPRKKFLK